ncbi:helix-turn-helix domain-containing protein [Amycolatopsis sp. cmx-4-68]|uniref:helix-turn-helix domain-containing protein n=1 Tax=Amycolatopsis sp. cmx-4-68 TaxID=2790938 RepID=UPI003978D43A
MRLEAEFTSEPFRGEGSPPEHAVAARDAAAEAGLDTDFGPLGTLVRGDADELLGAIPAIAKAALEGGATQVTLQVRRTGAETTTPARPSGAGDARSTDGTSTSGSRTTPHAGQAAGPQAGPEGADNSPVVALNDALARLIADVERELGAELGHLDRAGKQRAVRLLRERGAFGLRKSVSSVADALGVTRFTVYNYLNREAD